MNQATNPTLILGGGFTGLFTALHLNRQNYERAIVLIDRQERFTFQPLLYEFFSEEMSATQVCPPYEELLSGTDVTFVRDTIEEINLEEQQVNLAFGLSYTYEYLVLA